MSDNNRNMKFATLIGIFLVGFGVFKLGQVLLGPWWNVIQRIYTTASYFLWPLAIILVGAAIVWSARKGSLGTLKGKTLYRSSQDKWIKGVIAGLANYINIDPLILRAFYIVFGFLNPWLAVILYVIGAIIIPEDPIVSSS